MSGCVNRVMLVGRCARDPAESHQQPGSVSVVLGLSEMFRDPHGVRRERMTWVRVRSWDGTARVFRDHIRKGSYIAIEGHLEQFEEEGRDGGRVRGLEVVCERVTFLGRPRSEGE